MKLLLDLRVSSNQSSTGEAEDITGTHRFHNYEIDTITVEKMVHLVPQEDTHQHRSEGRDGEAWERG